MSGGTQKSGLSAQSLPSTLTQNGGWRGGRYIYTLALLLWRCVDREAGAVCGWAEEGGGAHAPTPYFLALDTSVQLPWLSIRLGLGSGMCGFTPCEAACVVASSTPPPSQPNQARVA